MDEKRTELWYVEDDMKKIILGTMIAMLIILGGAGYRYFVLRQNGPVSPDTSFTGEYPVAEKSQTQKMPRELVGVWRPEQFFEWYAPENQYRAVVASPSDQNALLKFENGFLCQGQISLQEETFVCQEPIPVVIQGNVLLAEGVMIMKWTVQGGKLELIFLGELGSPPGKRVILTKYK